MGPACCRRKQCRVPSPSLVPSLWSPRVSAACCFPLLASRFTIHILPAIHNMHLKNPINNSLHHITSSSRQHTSSSINSRTPLIPAGQACPRLTAVSIFSRAKHRSIIETTLTHLLQTRQHSLLLFLSLASTSPRRLCRHHLSQKSKAAATNSFSSIGVYIFGP
jgi:hypothetical protein